MNRKIKFRAWDKKAKIFSKNVIVNFFDTGSEGYENGVDRFEIMQYTGLKDKNGKDIYEGDIVRRYGVAFIGTYEERKKAREEIVATSKIEWNEDELCYMIEGDTNLGIYSGYSCLEIIGNIYQNPELIK